MIRWCFPHLNDDVLDLLHEKAGVDVVGFQVFEVGADDPVTWR